MRAAGSIVVAALLCAGSLAPVVSDGRAGTTRPAATSQAASRELAACLQLIRQGDYARARALAAEWIEREPRNARAHGMMGLAYHMEDRHQQAVAYFERALALDAADDAVRSAYGWCLYYLGRAADARAQFERLLKSLPDHADSHFALAVLDLDEDQLDSAVDRFRRAIDSAAAHRRKEDEARYRIRFADLLTRREDWTQAQTELARAVKLNPDLYAAYYKLSRVRVRLGDVEGARAAQQMHDQARRRVRPPSE